MNNLNFEDLFSESFDTFKVFDNLKLTEINAAAHHTPKTVWQILNHLIIWQQHQLNILNNQNVQHNFNEVETWNTDRVEEQHVIDKTVQVFKQQIKSIKQVIASLNINTLHLQLKLKCILDITGHLSFHLGEIILIRRQMGNFPLPHEMSKFLTE